MIDRGDELVTVFGGGGFIGRYVCEILLRSGKRVRIASRNPRSAYFIQPLGQVGQIGYLRADITEPESIARAVDGAASVVNLCGILKGRFRAVHVTGAGNCAEAARDAGAQEMVHIATIG